MTKWTVNRPLLKRAREELALLFTNLDLKAEIERVMSLLSKQPDPRKPDPAMGLNVERLQHVAPDWYRISLLPKFNVRIIFRLLVAREDRVIEISQYELPEDDEGFIDIVRAVYRTDETYSAELRRRWKGTRNR